MANACPESFIDPVSLEIMTNMYTTRADPATCNCKLEAGCSRAGQGIQ